MWLAICLPRTGYGFLYPFRPLFRCSQVRHFVILRGLLVAIIRVPEAGTLKGLCPYLTTNLSYWALIRMLRWGKWEAQEGTLEWQELFGLESFVSPGELQRTTPK